MRFIVDNCNFLVQNGNVKYLRRLDAQTAYLVQGYRFAQAYRKGHWDGMIHLCKLSPKGVRAPVGLLIDAMQLADTMGITYEVEDRRRPLHDTLGLLWHREDIEPRDYQQEAVNTIFRERRGTILQGKGMIRLPPRTGKTVMAARAILELDRPALFIVNSDQLLRQTVALFESIFQRRIGQMGGGIWKPTGVIDVATVQTLIGKKFKRLDTSSYDMVFFDECHHLEADKWRRVLLQLDAMYKVGLSATIFLSRTKPNDSGIIWLRACTGKVLFTRGVSEMIEAGWLMRPTVRLFTVERPDMGRQPWSQELYDKSITFNDELNDHMIKMAAEHIERDSTVLIAVRRIPHTKELMLRARALGLNAQVVTGSTPAPTRVRALKRFDKKQLMLLIGTVFGEAIDMPNCSVVINGEGGGSKVSTYQRFRNLTAVDGKTGVEFIDYAFMGSEYLARHSLERLKVYRSEPAFKVRDEGAI